ncbi:MAG TPA: hypothetical protein VGI82_13600 [Chitinophagaceae bacterium]|jgi:hypothetical protein
MKKFLLILLVLLILFLSFAYIFIPNEVKISSVSLSSSIPKNIIDCLHDSSVIRRWWPAKLPQSLTDSINYGNYNYSLKENFMDGAVLQLESEDENFLIKVRVVAKGKDSSAAEIGTSFNVGSNPFKRIGRYYKAFNLKNDLRRILVSLLDFARATENIYGFHIERTTFTDTILYATKFSSKTNPSTQMIYDHINELKNKIRDSGAIEKDYPMLNVKQKDSSDYEIMIAICVNREIGRYKNYFPSRMVNMKDRFLKTIVLGGLSMVESAHQAIDRYMDDRSLSQPGIPFDILVTDRSKEVDTTKWRTIIFYPSM